LNRVGILRLKRDGPTKKEGRFPGKEGKGNIWGGEKKENQYIKGKEKGNYPFINRYWEETLKQHL